MQEPLPSPNSANALILVVDDDRSLRTLLSVALEQEKYTVAQATSGEQCLVDVLRLQPDMILLDAMMTGIDGFECCSQLRRMPETQDVPILMTTVLDDQGSVDRAFAAGATDYITKPIHWAVLSQRVRQLLLSYHTRQHRQILEQRVNLYEHWLRLHLHLLQRIPGQASDRSELIATALPQVQHLTQADQVFLNLDPAFPDAPWQFLPLSVEGWENLIQTLQESPVLYWSSGTTEPTTFPGELVAIGKVLGLSEILIFPLGTSGKIQGVLTLGRSLSPGRWVDLNVTPLQVFSGLLTLTWPPVQLV